MNCANLYIKDIRSYLDSTGIKYKMSLSSDCCDFTSDFVYNTLGINRVAENMTVVLYKGNTIVGTVTGYFNDKFLLSDLYIYQKGINSKILKKGVNLPYGNLTSDYLGSVLVKHINYLYNIR